MGFPASVELPAEAGFKLALATSVNIKNINLILKSRLQ